MKDNKFKKALAEGRIPVGHMVFEFATRGIARVLDSLDLDFAFVDMEHTGFDTDRVADLMAWFKATDIAPFVRVPQGLYHFLARTMDAGALGVMVANVETAEQARSIVDAVKYAPLGKRGVALGTAHTDFLVPDPPSYFRRANENTTVFCMIESPTGLANADRIAAVEGVDVLWVGHYDLTQAMGIPGEFQHPDFLQALADVVAAARKHGKAAGMQPGSKQQLEQWLGIGFNVISWKSDVGLYRAALESELQSVRTRLAPRAAAQP
ncbi:MAG: HpcH/HpaI aldolase family protein [Bryobacteraceae bacterium]